ncbi:MAG: hypothetical protein JWO37_3376 [Acidimicrobiales bacterium]|jgi:hypothetical protein|nr:hypothetical protein [Acidimicrobiales bacterium]
MLAAIFLLGLVSAGCFEHPQMTREDARAFAKRALTKVGFRQVVVSTKVDATTYKSSDPGFIKDTPVAVWSTTSQVEGGTVVLDVQRRGRSAVYVKDTRADGAGPLLGDAQFGELTRFRYDPAGDRNRRDARPWAIAAVALIVVVGGGLFVSVLSGSVPGGRRLS